MATTVEQPMWLTVRGARTRVGLAWLAWLAVAGGGTMLAVGTLGPAGVVLAVLAAGWFAARLMPVPLECLRRYHLDDEELVAMGPGPYVRRLAWTRVETMTQQDRSLRFAGPGAAIHLPLATVMEAGAWPALLARAVPALATEMWERLDEGDEVRLVPSSDPTLRAVLWWACLPAAVACVAGAGAVGAAVAVGATLGERTVALVRARARAVRLVRTGVRLRRRAAAFLVPWMEAEIVRARCGLLVAAAGGPSGMVTSALPNFWAVVPVIELRAQLGAYTPASVHFRVRVADGELAVIGEVEPAA